MAENFPSSVRYVRCQATVLLILTHPLGGREWERIPQSVCAYVYLSTWCFFQFREHRIRLDMWVAFRIDRREKATLKNYLPPSMIFSRGHFLKKIFFIIKRIHQRIPVSFLIQEARVHVTLIIWRNRRSSSRYDVTGGTDLPASLVSCHTRWIYDEFYGSQDIHFIPPPIPFWVTTWFTRQSHPPQPTENYNLYVRVRRKKYWSFRGRGRTLCSLISTLRGGKTPVWVVEGESKYNPAGGGGWIQLFMCFCSGR